MAHISFKPNQMGDIITFLETVTNQTVQIPSQQFDNSLLGTSQWGSKTFVSLDVAARLGFQGIADFNAGKKSQAIIINYWLYGKFQGQDPIMYWHYASGFRLAIAVDTSNLQISISSLPAIAGSVEVQKLSTSTDIFMIGMGNAAPMPIELFKGREFNVETYKELDNWMVKMFDYLQKNRDDLRPEITGVEYKLDLEPVRVLLDQSNSVIFAMYRILYGTTLRRALKIVDENPNACLEISRDTVKYIYREICNNHAMLIDDDPAQDLPITDGQKEQAKDWLFKHKSY